MRVHRDTGMSVTLSSLPLISAALMGRPLICDQFVAILHHDSDKSAVVLIDWYAYLWMYPLQREARTLFLFRGP
ncbi:hypothetical protein C8R45DRAFT_1019465 [Mycena sanguinolenta]|nr:hypothetical protein C8R45DRAFT_1019465 [Mycena sanguinolenta]